MVDLDPYSISELRRIFSPTKGWEVVEIKDSQIDRRPTIPGSQIRCIDKRYGQTENGYDPNIIPKGPAWLGGVDGISAFSSGICESRMRDALNITRILGFDGHLHGDEKNNDLGCAFRKALIDGNLPDLSPLDLDDWRKVRDRWSIPYTELHLSDKNAEGFLFNQRPLTTGLPMDCRYYPIDFWFSRMVGIDSTQALSAVEKCGELILNHGNKTLYVVSDRIIR